MVSVRRGAGFPFERLTTRSRRLLPQGCPVRKREAAARGTGGPAGDRWADGRVCFGIARGVLGKATVWLITERQVSAP